MVPTPVNALANPRLAIFARSGFHAGSCYQLVLSTLTPGELPQQASLHKRKLALGFIMKWNGALVDNHAPSPNVRKLSTPIVMDKKDPKRMLSILREFLRYFNSMYPKMMRSFMGGRYWTYNTKLTMTITTYLTLNSSVWWREKWIFPSLFCDEDNTNPNSLK